MMGIRPGDDLGPATIIPLVGRHEPSDFLRSVHGRRGYSPDFVSSVFPVVTSVLSHRQPVEAVELGEPRQAVVAGGISTTAALARSQILTILYPVMAGIGADIVLAHRDGTA